MRCAIERQSRCSRHRAHSADGGNWCKSWPEPAPLSGRGRGAGFRLSAFPRTKLAERLEPALNAPGGRGRVREDSAPTSLWKAASRETAWERRSGGRPGWHIECSAMAMEYLGEFRPAPGRKTDVSAHRERDCTERDVTTTVCAPLDAVRFLLVDGQMSKTGDFYTLRTCC